MLLQMALFHSFFYSAEIKKQKMFDLINLAEISHVSLLPWIRTLETYPLGTLQARSVALCHPRPPRCPLHPQNLLIRHKRSVVPLPAPVPKLLCLCKLGCVRAHVPKSTTHFGFLRLLFSLSVRSSRFIQVIANGSGLPFSRLNNVPL